MQRAGFGDAAVAAFLSLLSLSLSLDKTIGTGLFMSSKQSGFTKKKGWRFGGVMLGFYGSTAIMAKGSVKRHNLKICRLLIVICSVEHDDKSMGSTQHVCP